MELHNYSAANSVTQKEYNWQTLNDKVFRRFGFNLTADDIEQIVRARPGVIERTLLNMRTKLESAKARKGRGGSAASQGTNRQGGVSQRGVRRQEQRNVDQQQRQPRRQQPVHQQRRQQQQQSQQPTFQPQQQQQQQFQQQNYNMDGGGQMGQFNNRNNMYPQSMQKEVDQEMLEEKEQEVLELRETVDILELKVKKLEQLVRLKDSKIQALTSKLNGGM